VKVTAEYASQTQRGSGSRAPLICNLVAVRGGWSAPIPHRVVPFKAPGIHCTAGWVIPRAGIGERRTESLLVVPDFEPRIVKRIASRYID
jgi:hypothetical protein